jgi:hypothetical protein
MDLLYQIQCKRDKSGVSALWTLVSGAAKLGEKKKNGYGRWDKE